MADRAPAPIVIRYFKVNYDLSGKPVSVEGSADGAKWFPVHATPHETKDAADRAQLLFGSAFTIVQSPTRGTR